MYQALVNEDWSLAKPSSSALSRRVTVIAEKNVYQKTATILEMMKSKERIPNELLDFIAGSFGDRWNEVTDLLQIPDLFVDRMIIDHKNSGGIKEVKTCLSVVTLFFITIIFFGYSRSCMKF